jgi:hypothetical protein
MRTMSHPSANKDALSLSQGDIARPNVSVNYLISHCLSRHSDARILGSTTWLNSDVRTLVDDCAFYHKDPIQP